MAIGFAPNSSNHELAHGHECFFRETSYHTPYTNTSVQQRVELLRCGLGERVASVKKQASLMLRTWLDDTCSSDVVKLLEYLDVQSHEGLCIC